MDHGRLETWRNPQTEARIAVESWGVKEPVQEQFIERPRSARMIWNYMLRVGPVAVWRKVRSRMAEQRRNSKVVGVGMGRVVEAPSGSALEAGQRVIFLAPNHSPEWTHISLDIRLMAPAMIVENAAVKKAALELPESLRTYAGWSPYSGKALDATVLKRELTRLTSDYPSKASSALRGNGSTSTGNVGPERLEVDTAPAPRPSVVLFGLGNYAKTQIVPGIRRHLHLAAVHEIDTDQIGSAGAFGVTLDTCPWPRDGEHYDAWFIAGFHHTHAPLAIRALETGAYAVVEKPLVTTREQFNGLEGVLRRTETSRLFACFQKRYSRLNERARSDLRVPRGEPVDMHCLVYEIPLPRLHWYNWPNSGSRLVSNGCHWLDYFLYLNNYSPVADLDAQPLRDGDLAAWVRLDNGAQLVMSLTETGSQRLGVRDVIDLRARDVTIRMVDATLYESECSSRVLHRERVNPLESYRRMYDQIGRRIAAKEPGDPLESLRSTTLMLDLQDELQTKRSSKPGLKAVR
jgi:predicted dehydrogenase